MVGEQEVCQRRETQIFEVENFVSEILFDLGEVQFEGIYADELSAYRAKRTWLRTLEASFLLDLNHDFNLSVHRDENGHFNVVCCFESACGRYAFWRLTHNQAPDVQHIIRTAHIPQSELFKVKDNSSRVGRVKLLERIKSFVFSKLV